MNAMRSLRTYTAATAMIVMLCALPVEAQTSGTPGEEKNQGFLRHVYQDLLGRAITSKEERSSLIFLNGGGTRNQLAQGILSGVEYRTKLIASFYQDFLNREADPSGLSFFLNLLGAGTTDEQVIAIITGSEEYFQKAGGTNNDFLDEIYQDLLDRSIDPGALNFFTSFLNNGGSRQEVATAILSSLEYLTKLVESFYQKLLDRSANPGELSIFVDALMNGATDEQVIAIIVASEEYFNKVVYNIVLQDDSSGNVLKIDSATGDYLFVSCPGLIIGGKGTVRTEQCVTHLNDSRLDRHVSAQIKTCFGTGQALIKLSSRRERIHISDSDINNNTGICPR